MTSPKDSRATLIGWIVVAIAAVLRLGWLDLAAYQYDEADVLLRVFDMQRGRFPLSGAMTSWGVPDPPYMVYFAWLVAWLPQPALAAAGLVAVLTSLPWESTYRRRTPAFRAVGGAGQRLPVRGESLVGLFRSALLDGDPAVFTAVAFWAALEITQRRDPRWLPILGAALATQIQARLLGGLYCRGAYLHIARGVALGSADRADTRHRAGHLGAVHRLRRTIVRRDFASTARGKSRTGGRGECRTSGSRALDDLRRASAAIRESWTGGPSVTRQRGRAVG